jgi:hypothetical protein
VSQRCRNICFFTFRPRGSPQLRANSCPSPEAAKEHRPRMHCPHETEVTGLRADGPRRCNAGICVFPEEYPGYGSLITVVGFDCDRAPQNDTKMRAAPARPSINASAFGRGLIPRWSPTVPAITEETRPRYKSRQIFHERASTLSPPTSGGFFAALTAPKAERGDSGAVRSFGAVRHQPIIASPSRGSRRVVGPTSKAVRETLKPEIQGRPVGT